MDKTEKLTALALTALFFLIYGVLYYTGNFDEVTFIQDLGSGLGQTLLVLGVGFLIARRIYKGKKR